MKKEDVLVFSHKVLDHLDPFDKLLTKYPSINLDIILKSSTLQFMDREKAENNPNWKQLITYSYMQCGEELIYYQRPNRGNENRLYNKFSVGIGGHINKTDTGMFPIQTLYNARKREIEEELGMKYGYSITLEALIYDPIDDVGKVHFGVISKINLFIKDNIASNKEEIGEVFYVRRDSIQNLDVHWESWSKCLVENIFK